MVLPRMGAKLFPKPVIAQVIDAYINGLVKDCSNSITN